MKLKSEDFLNLNKLENNDVLTFISNLITLISYDIMIQEVASDETKKLLCEFFDEWSN